MSSSLPELIAVPPNTRWQDSNSQREGQVLGLGQDGALLGHVTKDDSLTSLLAIAIILPDGKRYPLHGKVTQEKDDSSYFMTDTDVGRDNLRDAIGQIRKDQHILICRDQDVEASDRRTGFAEINFIPEALPDLDFDEIDTSSRFLGRTFAYPMLITGMTGGLERGAMINLRLAQAAAALNIPMGVGSQRVAIDNPDLAAIFAVKRTVPGVFLIGNLGFAQLLTGDPLSLAERAVAMIEADALAIHLNLIQELVQVEGDRHFKGLWRAIEHIARRLPVPLMVKEVGSGISPATARRLADMGIAALDIGGRGGTSWGYIEGLRSLSPATQALAKTFRDWGLPTAESLRSVHTNLPGLPLVATGGIRDGLTVAKAVALGASMVGIGLPLLRAALAAEGGPYTTLQTIARGLKITMMATGSRCLQELEQALAPLPKRLE